MERKLAVLIAVLCSGGVCSRCDWQVVEATVAFAIEGGAGVRSGTEQK